jgi:hypothetical protein
MKFKTMLGSAPRAVLLVLVVLVLLFIGLTLNTLYPIEKTKITPDSVWVLVVDREVRQMPTPADAELLSYATKGDGVHLLGYDAARYKWTQNPTGFEVWVNYWKKLGYEQIDRSWSNCDGLHAQLKKTNRTGHVDMCHDPETRSTWIEKTP